MQEVSNQNIDQQEALAFLETYKKKFVVVENHYLFDAHKNQFTNIAP